MLHGGLKGPGRKQESKSYPNRFQGKSRAIALEALNPGLLWESKTTSSKIEYPDQSREEAGGDIPKLEVKLYNLDHGSNAEDKQESTKQCKNKDGPPRLVHELRNIGDALASAKISGRQAWQLMMVVMMTAWMVAWFSRSRSLRRAIVIVIVVFLLLPVKGSIIHVPIIATWRRILIVLGVICIVLGFLAPFLSLPTLHPSLLQEASLLGQSLPILSILPLILPNQGLRRPTKDILVFTELADPRRVWGIVKICILLLDAAFASSVCIEL